MSENVEELKKQVAEAEERATKWEKLHAASIIKPALLKAAERAGAYHAPQLLPWLEKDARLEEVNGQFVVRVVSNEGGKEVSLSPDQAVAALKRRADHANLFKDTMAQQPTSAAPAKTDVRKWLEDMSQEQFLRIRAERPELLGLAPLPKQRR